MSFMQPQITGRLRWLELHGDHGITYIPARDVPETLPTICTLRADLVARVLSMPQASSASLAEMADVREDVIEAIRTAGPSRACEDRAELARFDQYYDGSHVEILGVRMGYGVRESAPGYMDCTAWEVLDTRALAEALYKSLLDASDED